MKHLIYFEKLAHRNPKYKVGDFVRLDIENIDRYFPLLINNLSFKVSRKELTNIIFRITEYDKFNLNHNDDEHAPYYLENVDINNKFVWGWTEEKLIKLLPPDEVEYLKYNL